MIFLNTTHLLALEIYPFCTIYPHIIYFDIFKLDTLSSVFPEFPRLPAKQVWEDLFELKPSSKALISYITFNGALGNYSIKKNIVSKWEQELGFKFKTDYWDRVTVRKRNSA